MKTLVGEFLDQKVRARNFEARDERTVTGTPAKRQKAKRNQLASKGSKEVAFN